MRKVTVAGEEVHADIGSEAEDDLRGKDDTVPFMEAQVEGIDLAEGEKEHTEDEPRERRLEGQEPTITDGADEHAKPKSVTIEKLSQNE